MELDIKRLTSIKTAPAFRDRMQELGLDLRFLAGGFVSNESEFAAMKWRIARVNDPTPGIVRDAPRYYEINPTWESDEIRTFSREIRIPREAVEAGGTYRVRLRMKDSAGRWSHWSAPVQFVAGPPKGS